MRKFFATLIFLGLVYLLGGWVATEYGLFKKDTYLFFAAIVATFSSIIGLFAFFRPTISRYDLKQIEMQSLRQFVETSTESEILKTERAETKQELDDLAIRKQEMEVSVKKASLSLFLKDQHLLYEKKLLAEFQKNPDIPKLLLEFQSVREKLEALNEEIETDPNVALLKEIIESSSQREPKDVNLIEFLERLNSPIFAVPIIIAKFVIFAKKRINQKL